MLRSGGGVKGQPLTGLVQMLPTPKREIKDSSRLLPRKGFMAGVCLSV